MCTEKMSFYFYSFIFLKPTMYFTFFVFAEKWDDQLVVERVVTVVFNLSLEC